MGLRGVDLKSTVISHGLAFLFFNKLLNHFVGNVARTDCQIPSRPRIQPKPFCYIMRKFRQQNPKAYALQPLHDLAYVLRRAIRDEHVNVVTGDLASYNF